MLTIPAPGEEADFDFIEGLQFSEKHGVIVTGRHVDPALPDVAALPKIRFDRASDPWFYLHAESTTDSYVDVALIQTYLFRYDRGAFWTARETTNYFRLENTRFTRWLLNPILNARAVYKMMKAIDAADLAIIQDLMVPVKTSTAFVDYLAEELGIWPLWLCPVRKVAQNGSICAWPFYEDSGDMTINFGVWGAFPEMPWSYADVRRVNRRMEEKLRELHGMKVPYAAQHYTAAEFWSLYDLEESKRLRAKWHAECLPNMYDKVGRNQVEEDEADAKAVDDEQARRFKKFARFWPFKGLWPLIGLYQAYHAAFR